MPDFNRFDQQTLRLMRENLAERYRELQSRHLSLDMTRGKPCAEQLDLSHEMLNCIRDGQYLSENGIDCRNYGGVDGIPEAKRLFAEYLEVTPEEIIIGGNSSLNLMHDTVMRAMIKGVVEGAIPWGKLPQIKFLCPSPGYDRHFSICEYLGIEMIPIQMNATGLDMDTIETLVAEDERIKGIWCVPKYSNPTGVVYADEVVDRLACMKTKAADFRIFWDNAYAVHHLADQPARLKNIITACKQAGNPDRVFVFGSTSKITFAGSGLALMAASKSAIAWTKKQIGFQTIGPDKLNQLQHTKFFKNMEGIEDHMKKHAAILKPKFDAVQNTLEKELGDKNIADWSHPTGGYFVSIDTLTGCADDVIKMAGEAGVKLTPAGSTYPYCKDPMNRNIRIAPSFPSQKEICSAIELLSICIQRVSIEKKIGF
jgi:aspartate/methionine/tyrosine aminotransferase